MENFLENEARGDFDRVRSRALFGAVLGVLKRSKRDLLSLQEVRDTIKPRGETFRGIRQVPLDKIVGSEGRYADFTKEFLPRHEHLRLRWQRVDMAHLGDIILPPITLYEIGGVYFVRDGNHRVSVARMQGATEIDAEVTSLSSTIPLRPGMTTDDLRAAVIARERADFYARLPVESIVGSSQLHVTATGRYDELETHVMGHKYFINQGQKDEISVNVAIGSWHRNVYLPIVDVVREAAILAKFPGRTETDLYLWIVKHWDELKRRYGNDFPIHEAARDFVGRFGARLARRIGRRLGIRRPYDPPLGD